MHPAKEVPPTVMQLITARASKTELVRAFGRLTVDQILDRKFPSVGKLKRAEGLEKVENAVAVLMLDLSASFDGELGPEDAEELSVEITSSHLSNLSLEDVYYVCRKMKSGSHFGKLNVNKVMKALEDHFEEKTKQAGLRSYNNHLAMNPVFQRPTLAEKTKEFRNEQVKAIVKNIEQKTQKGG